MINMKLIKNKSVFASVLFLLCGFGWLGCEDDFTDRRFDTDEEYMQIYDYVKSREDLSIYKELCDYSGFYSTVSTRGSYTAFVPTNEAFEALYEELGISSFKEKAPEYWMYYMKYHTIETKLNTNSFDGGYMKDNPTMMGDDYSLTLDVTSYIAIKLNNKATITEYNIDLQNGYVNVVDKVLNPPLSNIYDLLKANGGYTKILGLFEKYGYLGYLTDSVATILAEPDDVLEGRLDPDTLSNQADWVAYHIYPGERSFVSNLDKRTVASLYKGDITTFNLADSKTGSSQVMYVNMTYSFSNRAQYGSDQIALNGILHAMADPLAIIDHTPGIIRHNLYGRDNVKKGYDKNVFADSVTMGVVKEHTSLRSFHQGDKPPVCAFVPSNIGDAFELTIPDVVKGTYTIRLIYYSGYSCRVGLSYKNTTVNRDIDLPTSDGNFEEMSTLQYKDLGSIYVDNRGDVTLRFTANTTPMLIMDMIELRPVL